VPLQHLAGWIDSWSLTFEILFAGVLLPKSKSPDGHQFRFLEKAPNPQAAIRFTTSLCYFNGKQKKEPEKAFKPSKNRRTRLKLDSN
jgi:hypothetical protein